jgi:hypothetical protein
LINVYAVLVAGRVRRFHVRPAAIPQGGAQIVARPGAVLGQSDQVGIVRGDFFDNAGQTRAAAVADVPGEEGHAGSMRGNSATPND